MRDGQGNGYERHRRLSPPTCQSAGCWGGGRLYEFSIAAVTDFHKPSGLNNTDLFAYSSFGQKSDMGRMGLKSKCWQGCHPRGESVSWLFPASGGCPHSVAEPPSSPQSPLSHLCFLLHLPSLTLTSSLFLLLRLLSLPWAHQINPG